MGAKYRVVRVRRRLNKINETCMVYTVGFPKAHSQPGSCAYCSVFSRVKGLIAGGGWLGVKRRYGRCHSGESARVVNQTRAGAVK